MNSVSGATRQDDQLDPTLRGFVSLHDIFSCFDKRNVNKELIKGNFTLKYPAGMQDRRIKFLKFCEIPCSYLIYKRGAQCQKKLQHQPVDLKASLVLYDLLAQLLIECLGFRQKELGRARTEVEQQMIQEKVMKNDIITASVLGLHTEEQ